MDKKAIGEKIASIRKQKGLTQKELAEKLCVTDKTISKWETAVNYPDIAIMESLALVLDISVVELLGLEQASSNDVIKEMTMISLEEKNEIKKGIRFRAKLSIASVLILIFAEIYLYLELVKIGLNGGIYGSFTIGLIGAMGAILGSALYSLENSKKL